MLGASYHKDGNTTVGTIYKNYGDGRLLLIEHKEVTGSAGVRLRVEIDMIALNREDEAENE